MARIYTKYATFIGEIMQNLDCITKSFVLKVYCLGKLQIIYDFCTNFSLV